MVQQYRTCDLRRCSNRATSSLSIAVQRSAACNGIAAALFRATFCLFGSRVKIQGCYSSKQNTCNTSTAVTYRLSCVAVAVYPGIRECEPACDMSSY